MGRYRKDAERTVRTQGSGNHRGRMLSGSHPHIRSNATTSECSEVHEISKEQEQLDDIGLTCKPEI